MFKRILIANRGEVALRIIRACKELNVETVLVYSTEDKDSLPVKLSTESICIGPAKAGESYLNIARILSAAINTNCDAIHPGYGFLSETYEFADLIEKCNIKFIGPSKETIALLGNKSAARKLMIENNIPVVPGSKKDIDSFTEVKEVVENIGFPIIIKATSGGGGKGMRIVYDKENLEKEYLNAKKEAESSFGNSNVYIEKYIENPKHIEIQILADEYGNIIHLGERDCSIQRRNQKIIEEAPCVSLDKELRDKLGTLAVKIAKVSNYKNAGTVEFILDKDNNYYFLEMNTRLQVEHTISEMVTGIDIVKEQIKIAAGIKLKKTQKDIKIQGHSIELRINAENIYNNFMPSFGKIDFLNIPNGFNVRFDSYIYQGYKLSPFYDSLLGKLIVRADTRIEAIKKLRVCLEELVISGVDTNIDLHYGILHDLDFIKAKYNTSYLENKLNNEFKEFYEKVGGEIEK